MKAVGYKNNPRYSLQGVAGEEGEEEEIGGGRGGIRGAFLKFTIEIIHKNTCKENLN